MSPKRSIHVEIGCDPVIFTNNFIFTNYSLLTIHYSFHFLSLPSPSPSSLLHIPPFIPLIFFFQQSNDKTQVLLFPSKALCCFYVLDCIVHVSKSFEHPTHSKSTFPSNFLLFFPNTLPNLFQILYCFINHKPRQFRPSLSPFYYFHTPYHSAFRMLCNTIYPSFSTKKCTLPHILLQLKLCARFELLLHVPSYTLKNNILE